MRPLAAASQKGTIRPVRATSTRAAPAARPLSAAHARGKTQQRRCENIVKKETTIILNENKRKT